MIFSKFPDEITLEGGNGGMGNYREVRVYRYRRVSTCVTWCTFLICLFSRSQGVRWSFRGWQRLHPPLGCHRHERVLQQQFVHLPSSDLHTFRPKLANPIPIRIRVHMFVEPIWDSLMNHTVKDAVFQILKM